MANLSDAKIVDFNGLQFYHKNLMKKVDSKLPITDESTYSYMDYYNYIGYFKSMVKPVTIRISDSESAKLTFAGVCDGYGSDLFGDESSSGIVATTDPDLIYNWWPVQGSTNPYIYELNGIITNGSHYLDLSELAANPEAGPVFSPCTITNSNNCGFASIDYIEPYSYRYKQSCRIGDMILFAYVPENSQYCYIFSTTDGINLTYLNRIYGYKVVTGIVYNDHRVLVTGYDDIYKSQMSSSKQIAPDGDFVYELTRYGFGYSVNMYFTDRYNEEVTDPDTGNTCYSSHIIALNRYKDCIIASYVKNSFATDVYGSNASEPTTKGPVYLMKCSDNQNWEDITIPGVSETESIIVGDSKVYAVPYDSAVMYQEDWLEEVPMYESADLTSWSECGEGFVANVWSISSQEMGCIGGVINENVIIKADYVIKENKGIPAKNVIGLEDMLNEAVSGATIDMNAYIASDEAVDSIISSYEEV